MLVGFDYRHELYQYTYYSNAIPRIPTLRKEEAYYYFTRHLLQRRPPISHVGNAITLARDFEYGYRRALFHDARRA